ncbi:FGGY-family carbohydrate kinase [candidate division KSB1 bacterium]|nr:FGGY-family carbohydrate kinase [bacterium]NUM66532.1 FGGY-family carbohydrate kinase [candidate division KSB1 bacterium]
MGSLLLGIDVGTYSSKGVLVEPDGKVLRTEVVEHEMEVPRTGWAEQDAEAVWWGDVVKICRALLDGHPYSGDDVAGLAVSAIGPCLLPLDQSGKPLRKGILYGVDARASAEIEWLNQKLGEDNIYAFSGMALSSQAVGPKILWLQRHEPEVWQRTAHLTTASSYLIYRLTGEKVMDRHTASHYMPLMDIAKLEWSPRFAEHIAPLDRLPRLGWSDELAGRVSALGAAETRLKVGTPVAVGAVDALSEGISVGAVQPGDLMIMYGSTAFFILVVGKPTPDPRMWTVAGAFQRQYNLAAGMATTGSLTRWFRDELAADLPDESAYATLFQQAESVAPGAGGLLVLPYFSGERTPINDPKARGVIAGLTLAHSRAHLFRAVLEGVGYGIRHNIEAFNQVGAEVKRIIAVGGGTKSTTWLQIVSDISAVPQVVPEITIGASFGDAFLAGLAAGVLQRDDLEHWVRAKGIIRPDSSRRQSYDQLYQDYLLLYQRTREIAHRLDHFKL